MNIYLGNLSFASTEEDVTKLFAEYGEVSSVRLITDAYSGRSKGFGFVEMPNKAEAEAAIKGLNETSFGGRNIIVNEARPREEKPRGGRGGGGGGRR